MKSPSLKVLVPLAALALATLSVSHMSVWIKKDFADKYRRRFTLDGTFTVDHAKPAVNPIIEDGDIHVVTTCPQIGLPMVSEVMNARLLPDCVHLLQGSQGTGPSILFSGVWWLWMELPYELVVLGSIADN